MLAWAVGVAGIFTVLYMTVGSNPTYTLNLAAAIVLSVTSLLGRGYGVLPSADALAKPVSILSAIEGGIGTTIELLFVATFTRRLLGS